MTSRVDGNGAAKAGSQLQTQLYVNRRSDRFNSAICDTFKALDGSQIEWRSPIESDGYREYFGSSFLCRLDLDSHVDALRDFWPARGPQWDALGKIELRDGTSGVILVEGKSYPGELYSSGSGAQENSDARAKIERSLGWAQTQIGVTGKTGKDWTGRLYQDANRLAHLYWLNSIGVETWLVHALFTGDAHHDPTSANQWEEALVDTGRELGIAGHAIPRAGHVFLEAGIYSDLVG